MDAVPRNFCTAPITEAEKALFAFLEKVNRASNEITRADVDAVKDAGWSEEAIYDAVTVCALFNFYNAWVDATGVSDLPADAHAASRERLAMRGYVVADNRTLGRPAEAAGSVRT